MAKDLYKRADDLNSVLLCTEAEISGRALEMVDRNVLKDIDIRSVGRQLEIIETLKQVTKSQGKQDTLLIVIVIGQLQFRE